MKKSFIFFQIFTLLISTSAFALNSRVVTDLYEEGEFFQRVGYFSDSAEWEGRVYPRYCYKGQKSDVCPLIEMHMQESQEEAKRGAEEYLELISCQAVSTSTFEVAYNLHTDFYGSKQKLTSVSECR